MEFRKVLCNELAALMRKNEKIVILDADLAKPDGIYPLFQEFPNRCFQVGIAEANMAGLCAGFSAYDYLPIMVTFAPFATRRVFDQIAVSIAYAKQKVIIVGTDPGITAELNGGTHMSFEDIAIMRSIPDMVVYDAVDDVQLGQAIEQLLSLDKNVYIRMPRKTRPTVFGAEYKYEFGKADVVVEGTDITLAATGTMVYEALEASKLLKDEGINAEIISVNTIKPFDKNTLIDSIKRLNVVGIAMCFLNKQFLDSKGDGLVKTSSEKLIEEYMDTKSIHLDSAQHDLVKDKQFTKVLEITHDVITRK